MGDRVWVDLEQCKKLVDNICIIFQTKPSASTLQSSGEGGPSANKSSGGDTAAAAAGGGGGVGGEDTGGVLLQLSDVDVEPR